MIEMINDFGSGNSNDNTQNNIKVYSVCILKTLFVVTVS